MSNITRQSHNREENTATVLIIIYLETSPASDRWVPVLLPFHFPDNLRPRLPGQAYDRGLENPNVWARLRRIPILQTCSIPTNPEDRVHSLRNEQIHNILYWNLILKVTIAHIVVLVHAHLPALVPIGVDALLSSLLLSLGRDGELLPVDNFLGRPRFLFGAVRADPNSGFIGYDKC